MEVLYRTGVRLYGTLIRLSARVKPKARQWVEGRRDWQARLQDAMAGSDAPVVWFHCASLGEFEQGRPVMEAFRARYPQYRLVLTFFSPSGYEVRKKYAGAEVVAYLPLDSPEASAAFLERVRPQLAFFVKYEFWYYYLRELQWRQIPVLLISAIFREGQVFFRPWGRFYRQLLARFTHLFVQDEASAQLLASVGIRHVTVAGDTRFDRVRQIATQARVIPEAEQFCQGEPTLVVGSSWPADLEVLLPFLRQFPAPLKVIVAPHEIHEAQLNQWQQEAGISSVRFSQATPTTLAEARLLWIDNVGMLSSLYRYGHFAWIGGAYGQGLHNTLEAATFGMPLFFGDRNYQKFREARDLVAAGVAHPVADAETLTRLFTELYHDEARRATLAAQSRRYVAEQAGATEKILTFVEQTSIA
ncbi:3-deoxy-D-manno-octulosonic-acid transferase [Catalinimonas alkaloidigena]|uniref:3-deoxy-D-manno-octulosonic acid transferase n=1 Tax=Catalinimonas alkaloidigena TaxID=1075417 RepID=A0A1G9NX08_9BACT|nr:glycosyltransferase N-terminal domain-containing protein [Catalinimonas alkaloidigena]SDL91118.1 3-deoxy-D-manno-octulosonic-acid transferase [Catalinimonas alkaloidigena]